MKYIHRLLFLFVMFGFVPALSAQPNSCVTTTARPIVRAEGITERVGDIVYSCSGVPNSTITANFSISLNTNVSNRISGGNTLTGLVFTIENGSGPQPILVSPVLANQSTLAYSGVSLTFSSQGTFVLRLSGIRANASALLGNTQIIAFLGGNLPIATSVLTVAFPQTGLRTAYSNALVCAQYGSPLPDIIDFANLILANAAFETTRLTEGFADAFGSKSAPANLNADFGQRVIIRYNGFPQDARLFVPDVVAGSDAVQPTAGGDFGPAASGGMYAPTAGGTLLLARVSGAFANGGGGSPAYLPAAIGSGTVSFNSVSELQIVNGSAYAVYEVVDANPSAVETAQFPTFLGLGVNGSRPASVTSEQVFFAPVSTIADASTSEPVPRFRTVAPPTDCAIIGDCGTYLPRLTVNPPSFQFSTTAGGATPQSSFMIVNNGTSPMPWVASVNYGNGAGWLTIYPTSGPNSATVRIYAEPDKVAPGTYLATVTVDALNAGRVQMPVMFTVNAAPPPPPPLPTVTSVLNSASLQPVPAVAGSITTLMGSAFSGQNLTVTFDSLPAQVFFSNDTQINLVVPAELGSKASAQLIVTVDGRSSVPKVITLAPFEPGIFKGGILNQDGTVNDATHGAAAGSVIAIWATGLSGAGTITGHIADRAIDVPLYAGPAPELTGVQQINLRVPADLSPMITDVYVCGTSSADASKTCSIPVPLTLR